MDDIQGFEDQQTKVVERNIMQDLGRVIVANLVVTVDAAGG